MFKMWVIFWDVLILFLSFEDEAYCENNIYSLHKNFKFSIWTIKVSEYIWGVYKDIIFYKAKCSSSSDHWIGLEKNIKACFSENFDVLIIMLQ